MTLKHLFREGEKSLLEVFEPEEAKSSAWFLLAGCFAIDSKDYLLLADQEADPEKAAAYQAMIRRRIEHEPTAYILGEWEFMGLPFYVGPSVLIPRPDTETLVEEVLRYVKNHFQKKSKIRILDICTGSGCIIISLGHYLSEDYELDLYAGDLSPEALETAGRNADRNHVDVRFVLSDLLQEFESDRFDIIVCNPPYVASKTVEGLEPDVKDYEPHLALDGVRAGLDIYQRLIPELKEYLTDEGRVFFEIGDEQAKDVRKLMAESSVFDSIKVVKDLSGHNRVISGKRKQQNV